MKTTLIFILSALFLISCTPPAPDAKVNVTETITPIIIPPADPEPGVSPANIIITFFHDNAVKFWDGSAITTWKTGKSNYAGFRTVANSDVLYTLDQQGRTYTSKNIIGTYDFTIADGADVWSVKNITPDEALAAGHMYKYYTKIYLNAVEYGDCWSRDYKTTKFIKSGSDIMALNGSWYHINGIKTGFRSVNEDFNIYSVNTTAHTAKINDIEFTYTLNFFLASDHYQKSGSIWYSWNGYKWDGAALIQNSGCALEAWRQTSTYPISLPEPAVLIAAGIHRESGEDVLYYIECNSGWLFRYVPSINIMTQKTRLYNGDGYRATGLYYKDILKPVMAGDALYFLFDDNGIYRFKFDTSLTGRLTDGAEWVKGWE